MFVKNSDTKYYISYTCAIQRLFCDDFLLMIFLSYNIFDTYQRNTCLTRYYIVDAMLFDKSKS